MVAAARALALAAACLWALGATSPASGDAAGTTLFPVNLGPIHVATGNDAEGTELAFDGTNFLAVWNWGPNVYGARLSPGGAVLEPGVFTLSTSGYDPSVAFDGTQFLVAWADWLAEVDVAGEVHAVRVSTTGSVLDETPILVGRSVKRRPTPVAFDGTNFVVVWRTYNDWIRIAHVSPEGDALDGDGIDIGRGFYPQVACADSGCLFAWHAHGNGLDVDGRILSDDGTLSDGFPISAGTADQHHVSVATDGTGYLVAWSDGRSGNQENFAGTYATRISGGGTVLDDPALVVSKYNWIQGTRISAAFDGTDYVVAWSQYNFPVDHRLSDVYLRRIAPTGGFVDAEPAPISTGFAHQVEPVVGVAGDRYLVTVDDRGPPCPFGAVCVSVALFDRVPGTPTGPAATDGPPAAAGWDRLASPIEAPIHSVWAFGDDTAFAGTDPDGGSPPWDQNPLLEWNGAAWSIATMLPNARKYGLWGSSPTNLFTIGQGAKLVHWDGSTATFGGGLWARIAENDWRPLIGMAEAVWGFGGDRLFITGLDGAVARFLGSGRSVIDGGTCRAWGSWTAEWGTWDCAPIRGSLDNWDVWGRAEDDVYVVGEFGTLAHFDGGTWALASVPTRQSLNGVWGSCSGETFAVGDHGAILRHDGFSWTKQQSPTTENLYAVAGFDGSNVYAVGNAGTIVHYNGNAWTREDSGTDNTLEDVAAGESVVWAVGSRDHDWNGIGPGTILRKQLTISDASPPTNPVLASASHATDSWSADRTVDVSLRGGCDDGRGIGGYSLEFDHSATTIPDAEEDLHEGMVEHTVELADGEWYAHVRTVDRAGNWSADAAHFGPIRIDTTPPSIEVTSPSHQVGVPSSDSFVSVSWQNVSDGAGSGVYGYRFLWDNGPDTVPPPEADYDDAQRGRGDTLGDGTWYFHIRTVDNVGNWSSARHFGPVLIDTRAPTNPVPFSSSHAVGVPSSDNTIDISWSGALDEVSGLDGFSYSWDRAPGASHYRVKDLEETATGLTSPPLADGQWWFHLQTVDRAGNWSGHTMLGPFTVDTAPKTQPPPPPQPPSPPQLPPQPQPPLQPQPKPRPKAVPKVTLCHRGRTIKVPKSQVRKHRKHGDKLGPCKKKKKKRRR